MAEGPGERKIFRLLYASKEVFKACIMTQFGSFWFYFSFQKFFLVFFVADMRNIFQGGQCLSPWASVQIILTFVLPQSLQLWKLEKKKQHQKTLFKIQILFCKS